MPAADVIDLNAARQRRAAARAEIAPDSPGEFAEAITDLARQWGSPAGQKTVQRHDARATILAAFDGLSDEHRYLLLWMARSLAPAEQREPLRAAMACAAGDGRPTARRGPQAGAASMHRA